MSTLAKRLGYAPDVRLLIVHCDDFGMCHAQNVATQAALERGVASSASIMTPCPWRDEAIAYARDHPEMDIGMHGTVTSEWDVYRWGPVAPVTDVPSLVDTDGYLWKWEEPFAAHADPAEVEIELRAQYSLLRDRGVPVSHVDMHMQALVSKPAYFDVYAGLAEEWRLPFMFPNLASGLRAMFDPDYQRVSKASEEALIAKGLLVIDRLVMNVAPDVDRVDYYREQIADLHPGLTQIIVHVAEDTDELRALAVRDGQEEYSYRLADHAAVLDPRLRDAIAAHDVQLVTWREIGAVLYG